MGVDTVEKQMTQGMRALARGPATLIAMNAAARVKSQLAWREGMLTFDQTTVAEAAEEFNRYNKMQVVILDPEAAATRIGGTFQARNVEAFVRLLQDAYGLRVEVQPDRVRVTG